MKPQNQYMDSFLPADFYRKIRTGEFQRQLFPAFSDRTAWETIKRKKTRQPLIRELMKEAEPLRTAPPPVLLFSNYCQYGLNGNRSNMNIRISSAAISSELWFLRSVFQATANVGCSRFWII